MGEVESKRGGKKGRKKKKDKKKKYPRVFGLPPHCPAFEFWLAGSHTMLIKLCAGPATPMMTVEAIWIPTSRNRPTSGAVGRVAYRCYPEYAIARLSLFIPTGCQESALHSAIVPLGNRFDDVERGRGGRGNDIGAGSFPVLLLVFLCLFETASAKTYLKAPLLHIFSRDSTLNKYFSISAAVDHLKPAGLEQQNSIANYG